MNQYGHPELGWQQQLRVCLAILLLLVLNFTLAPNVKAQQPQFVRVRVVIANAGFNGCVSLFESPDFYFKGLINGIPFRSETFTSNFSPFVPFPSPFAFYDGLNIEFSTTVDLSLGTIPIKLQQWRAGFSGDELCNIQPGDKEDVLVNLDLVTCQVEGDLNGTCDTMLGYGGPLGPVGFNSIFHFSISREDLPRTSKLALTCLHDPIWPQPGDTVTITAKVFDGNGGHVFSIDNIEIWADNRTAPIATSDTTFGFHLSSFFHVNHKPASDAHELLYRCRATDANGSIVENVSTDWRRVQIGQPARGRAVGVINRGVSKNRVDIVFIADQTDYPNGPTDPQFLKDVSSIIRDSYYSSRAPGLPFLQNQDMINFWVALDAGDSHGSGVCPEMSPPENWDSDYIFADVGAIIRTQSFRECSQRGRRILAVASSSSPTVILHETAHAPIGLADEYCCDGGYFTRDPFSPVPGLNNFPNVYAREADCRMDQLAFGLPDACRPILAGNVCSGGSLEGGPCDPLNSDPSKCGICTRWHRLDPFSTINDDLMVASGIFTPQRADKRRIDKFFEICRMTEGKC